MLSSQKLLIIEDVSLIALDIQRVVDDAHAQQAVFARNFTEAEALADRFGEFDLAIVNPPAPEDFEIARKLLVAGPAIVVCTGSPATIAATPLMNAVVANKPFSDEELVAACRRALDGRSAN